MPAITSSTSFVLSRGSSVIFELGGTGTATVDPTGISNAYRIGLQEAFLGPYDRNVTILVTVEGGTINYRIDEDGDLSDQSPALAALGAEVSTKTRTLRTIAFLGDSRINQGIATAAGSSTVIEANGLQHWVPALLRQDGRLLSAQNFGVSGETSEQVLARVGDVIAARPDVCVVWCGTNDRASANQFTARRSIRAIRSIVNALTGAGIKVCLVAEIPRGNAAYPAIRLGTEQLANHFAVRDAIIAMDGGNVRVANPWPTTEDPATPGDVLTGLTRDGLHQTTLGAYTVALPVVDAIRPWVSEGAGLDVLPKSNAEVWSASNPGGWINDNPMLVGASGTKGAGMTGSLADGYSSNIASLSTGVTVVASKFIDSMGREWQQFDLSGSSTGSGAIDLIRQTGLHTRAAQNDQLQAACEIECIGLQNLRSVKVGVRVVSGSDSWFTDGDEPSDISPLPAAYTGVLLSQPITLPASVTDVQLRFAAYPIANAVVAGTVRVRALAAG
jgi:lysophospholipase L1-like esterase